MKREKKQLIYWATYLQNFIKYLKMIWTALKTAIAAVIKANNNQEITGTILQSTLNSIVNSIGANAMFVDVAIPTTNPGVPDGPVFYIASQSGRYSNFGNVNLAQGLHILLWDGTQWSVKSLFNSSLYLPKTNTIEFSDYSVSQAASALGITEAELENFAIGAYDKIELQESITNLLTLNLTTKEIIYNEDNPEVIDSSSCTYGMTFRDLNNDEWGAVISIVQTWDNQGANKRYNYKFLNYGVY